MRILLTGGAGYIGSHTAVELMQAGHEVIILDKLSNKTFQPLHRVEEITGKVLGLYKLDLLDEYRMQNIFMLEKLDAVIHFAGYKSVAESVSKPIEYYQNNLVGTINLCRMMQKHAVKKLVFSSSATVYGEAQTMPVDESCTINDTTSPYGRSKIMIERLLEDICRADSSFQVARLRYFNPAGAHESGKIGEDPEGTPNNLLPFITQVATGQRKYLPIFGNDYPTPDGTCIRDYIHVVDLAKGHLAALEKLTTEPGLVTYNLGTGKGYSVLDIVKAFEKANNLTLAYKITGRRGGDIAQCYADPTLALTELNWKAEKGIEEICRDAYRWQQKNPQGYKHQ